MIITIPQLMVDHHQPLGEMRGGVVPGHGDAAVHLDGLFGHLPGCAADQGFRHRDRAGVQWRADAARSEDGDGTGLLELCRQVHHSVLQALETANRAAELPPCLEVVEQHVMAGLHGADGLGAEGEGALVEGICRFVFGVGEEEVCGSGVEKKLGRALCPEPVLPALLSLTVLTAAGADISEALFGNITHALAIGEPDAPYGLDHLTTTAAQTATGWTLTGRKSVIYGGQIADRILVAAHAEDRLALFQVDPGNTERTPYGLIDGGGAAELFLDATPADLLLSDAENALADALDKGALALCAEAVGAMQACHEMLLDYLKTRQQFGRPIGGFQALQHRMVDLTTALEQARSITILAASRIGTPLQSRTVSMAKSLVGRTARHMAEETIQMHGGIAMTWDYAAAHYAKRLVMIDHQLGDSDYHLMQVKGGYSKPTD